MQIYLRKSCEKVRFCRRFCKNGRFLGDLCLCISKKSSNFAAKLRWWAKLRKTFIGSQKTQRKQNGELSELNELY